jgi:hypothetical protein
VGGGCTLGEIFVVKRGEVREWDKVFQPHKSAIYLLNILRLRLIIITDMRVAYSMIKQLSCLS